MGKILGNALRAARTANTSFSQQEACDVVNRTVKKSDISDRLTQATLSAWETGRQQPSEGSFTFLRTLAEVIGLTNQELEDVQAKDSAGTPSQDNVYASQVREWMETVPTSPSNVSVWFIAPNNFPAFTSHEIFKLWVSNLELGVTYNFLIIVNWLTDSKTFQQIASLLRKLESSIEHSNWSVRIFAYFSLEIPSKLHHSALMGELSELNELASDIGDGNQVSVNKLNSPPPVEIWHAIARSTPEFGRLVIFIPEFGSPAAASLMLTSTTSNFHCQEEPIYRWLNEDGSQSLREMLRLIQSSWLEPKSETQLLNVCD